MTKNVTLSLIPLFENEFSPDATTNGFVVVELNSNIPRCFKSKNLELVFIVTLSDGFVFMIDGLNCVKAKPLKMICTAYCELFIVFPSY